MPTARERPRAGGEFKCEAPIFETKRIKLFRSDLSLHSVTRVEGGTRYVLSLGWALEDRSVRPNT